MENESLELLLGSEYNKPTNMGKEYPKTDYAKRYKTLYLGKGVGAKLSGDTKEQFEKDLKNEIKNTKLSKNELIRCIEEQSYNISQSKRYGAFNEKTKSIVNILSWILGFSLVPKLFTIFLESFKENDLWGLLSSMVGISAILLLIYLKKVFSSSKEVELMRRYHIFLMRFIQENEDVF